MNTPFLYLLVFFLISLMYYVFPPKKINSFYGFRTFRSKENLTNWNFANNLASRCLLAFSVFNILAFFIIRYFNGNLESIIVISIILELVIVLLYVNYKLKKIKNTN